MLLCSRLPSSTPTTLRTMPPHGDQEVISRLSNELLLLVFNQNLPSATLAACAQTCKSWNRLATAVLYKHVTLTSTRKLASWSTATPPSLDATVQTLTICVTKVQTATGPEDPAITMEELRQSLGRLQVRISRMSELESLSITTPKKLTRGLWVSNTAISKILDNVPNKCLGLELVIRNGPYQASAEDAESHLCVAIRRLIPNLQFVRLALPSLCSECFGYVSSVDSPASEPIFTAVELPKLRECIIILASPKLGNNVERFDKPCNPDVSLASVNAIVESLVSLAGLGKAPAIEKLWVYDCLPGSDDEGYSYGAFVRRDVLANKSYTFPWNDIAPLKRADSFFIRMPEEEGGDDMITTRDNAACLVERHAWLTVGNGARLPAALMTKHGLHEQDCPVQTRTQWFESSKISTALWKNESDTGMRLLHGESGDLLENRPAVFRIPESWERGVLGFLRKAEL
ncbi:uncharacterized protein F4812DRAFT_91139 [Daldinia caldariorum]|uniref:uncharacterized protein n=1 Tax=Daldinia caldariorum TaxID=326644 RepID=UPI002007CEC3|nr:uncharacterized protein F4812DRAFT_91139 [Daldinia caldariorum]KAI1465969.1 hypothetical protein F4812DRAFT_91139 [Daldinia caldariorum]